jgi:TP901 family phage tail tape measure protein
VALAEQAELVVTLSLRDELSRNIRGIQARTKQLERDFQRTSAALGRTAQNFKTLGIIAGAGIGLTVKAFGDFEDQLATINTVANLTDDELSAVGESIRQLAMQTGLSLDDISGGYYDLVSAGVAAKDAQLVLTNATTLAIGGLATTGETVDLLTTAINSYGLKAGQVTNVTNGFAQAIAAGKVTAAELAASFARVAPLASAAGIGIDELQAGYAQLTSQGVPAAEAATQMRAAIQGLQKPTGSLSKLQKQLGVNFAQVAKQKGLQVAYQQLMKAADDLGISETELLGSVEALGYAYSVTGRNAKSYRDNLDAVRKSSEGNGVATDQMEKRSQTFNRTMARVRQTLNDIGIEVGTIFAPAIKRVADNLLLLVQENRPAIQGFADDMQALIDSVTTEEDITQALKNALEFLDTVDWATIGSGLSITGQAAKMAVDAFNAMPAPLKNALIALIAANKLTGGLVSGFVGDLAGIALRNLSTINAVNVTVIGRNVIGAGGGVDVDVPDGGGKKPGLLGRLTSWIPALAGAAGLAAARAAIPVAAAAVATGVLNTAIISTLGEVPREERRFGWMGNTGTVLDLPAQGWESVLRALGLGRGPVAPNGQMIPSTPGMVVAQQALLDAVRRQEGILIAQRNKFYEVHDELVGTGELSAEQKEQLTRIVGKLEAGKITAEEANRRLGKLDDAVRESEPKVTVKINAQTSINVADVGEKLIVSRGTGRFIIE